jgi:hypothetical protein
MDEALAESLLGEINTNLLSLGSARLLAIIDLGEFISYPDGHKLPSVLAARAGEQLRPGHLLAKNISRGAKLEMFLRMTTETGQLVMRRNPAGGARVADIRATMLRIIDDHARMSAEQFRWRMIHGALTASNMEISGAMLDLPTQSTQPRTAPIWVLPYPYSTFGREHTERALQLRPVYSALIRVVPKPQRDLLNVKPIDFTGEMEKAYQRHLEVMLLGAAGLKPGISERIQANDPELARRFVEILLQMAQLKNSGKVNIGARAVATVSALDIFHLLQRLPRIYFAAPRKNHRAKILANLKPVFRGNRFQVAGKKAMTQSLVKEFEEIYRRLMSACDSLAAEFYGSRRVMRESIKARADFENRPISSLFRMSMYQELERAVSAYKASSDPGVFREVIDRSVTSSLRSVDRLLAQGVSRRMHDGGFELQPRTIDGVNYSVRAWATGKHRRRLHVSLPVKREGTDYVTAIPGEPRLSERELELLRYRFTTDGWATWHDVGVQSLPNQNPLAVDFSDIATFPLVGLLAGFFHVKGGRRISSKRGVKALGEYPFAIPDRMELAQLMNG